MINNLEKRILDKIKKEKIVPKSKLFFVLKNSFIFSTYFISILLGSISFSVIFYIFSDNKDLIFDKYNIVSLKNAIIFWLILVFIFISLAFKNNLSIKNSYRYSGWTLILFNIFTSTFIGLLFFNTGLGKKTDELTSKHLNFYEKNIRITKIKENLFLQKLKDIGITNELIKKYPWLSKKIEDKFNTIVLEKRYLDNDVECKKDSYACNTNELAFKDPSGCGCKKIYR